ncbi:Transaldolase NQM1 [Nakaseomyces glabratus]|uniref:Transaldolase n=1 Tax=Candida glabrata TaxID=5478 RepID=A0A0W0C9G7_CANGB|nr:Transaldolase signature 1 [Nakaseomyces glabratus]KAH7584511.1 Transaldolase signature 1 [Nakaseomyces glabratus]KTA96438.1 Transaldolase NQM1 [Nakaseomyces glabratus]KTA99826.1 Transaldolase NQM1 [Nakaseomyces glabratus]KTB09650.1 Transaldolase NQM1 [Nakaseomyces glabratus]
MSTENGGNSTLENLRNAGTNVVTDTGEFELISKFKPRDSTTNPSLILAATKNPNYASLIDVAIDYAKAKGGTIEQQTNNAADRLLVEFGKRITDLIPGVVSTEVDARLSFDKKGTVDKALQIIKLYEENGVSKDRVLIKIASTWEGIQAARELEAQHGIHCNLTLLFNFTQAVACAEANVTLISPFIARVLDWYKANTKNDYNIENHPGVLFVKKTYNYYKKHGYKTIIMGASFRTLDEIRALAGLDNATLGIPLLENLQNSTEKIDRVLTPEGAQKDGVDRITLIDDEAKYRYEFNSDAMAVEKLADGIRTFAKDTNTLYSLLRTKLEKAN